MVCQHDNGQPIGGDLNTSLQDGVRQDVCASSRGHRISREPDAHPVAVYAYLVDASIEGLCFFRCEQIILRAGNHMDGRDLNCSGRQHGFLYTLPKRTIYCRSVIYSGWEHIACFARTALTSADMREQVCGTAAKHRFNSYAAVYSDISPHALCLSNTQCAAGTHKVWISTWHRNAIDCRCSSADGNNSNLCKAQYGTQTGAFQHGFISVIANKDIGQYKAFLVARSAFRVAICGMPDTSHILHCCQQAGMNYFDRHLSAS